MLTQFAVQLSLTSSAKCHSCWIEKAITEGKLFVELTREEIETVPDVTPDLFVAYLQDQGYTLLSNHKGSFALYFHNPMKD